MTDGQTYGVAVCPVCGNRADGKSSLCQHQHQALFRREIGPPTAPMADVELGRCSMSYRGAAGVPPLMFCWAHNRLAKFCFEPRAGGDP